MSTVSPAPLGVYIHWPYCARICPYCDFNVVRDRGRSQAGVMLVEAIARDLAGQAELMLASGGPQLELASIYFGGGTPSLMRPEHVARLISQVQALWPSVAPVEVTLESNPADADHAHFATLAAAGVNRLSLGVQSFRDEALIFLKRDHDAERAACALDSALATFSRVSLDLIYALPGQTPSSWAAELDAAVRRGAEHLSAYQLTLEPGTPMARAARRGLFQPADADRAAEFYDVTTAVMGERGFSAYEVSNFALGPAAKSRHNLVYWRGEAYVGVGPGAHGRVVLGGARTATEAERDVGAYIDRVRRDGVGWSLRTALDASEVMEERVLMGLRVDEGVAAEDIQRLDRSNALAALLEGGWLTREGGRVRATHSGRRLLDSVIGALLA